MFFDRYRYEITPWLRTVQRLLLTLIFVGLILLATQTLWVPPLVSYLLQQDSRLIDSTLVPVQTADPVQESEIKPSIATPSSDFNIDQVSSTSIPVQVVPITKVPDLGKKKACVVGGCSGQLCTDDPTMVSTCEYRPEYACYATATCARQATGDCGWVKTPELNACLVASSAAR